jgi:glucans biosynthesis protein C
MKSAQTPPGIARHAGLDWLRIGAFALLILYHIGLYFGPWGWHINAPRQEQALAIPLLALNPWRMTLLFLVSGYAVRAVLSRTRPSSFIVGRSWRLLLPLAFGVVLIVAPQPWVERRMAGTFPGGFLDYWVHDYLSWSDPSTPTLDNLWFLAYVWAYSVVVGAAAWVFPDRWKVGLQDKAERLLDSWQLLAVPILWLLVVRLVLFPHMMPTNRLLDDVNGHAVYFPAFLFGFLLARAPTLRPAAVRVGGMALAMAIASYGVVALELAVLGHEPVSGTPLRTIFRACTAIQSWSTIVALLALAERLGDFAPRWRKPLNEAVFPSYIVHQTAIVVIAWWIRPLDLSNWGQFALLLPGTCLACWLFYSIGKASSHASILFGVPRRPAAGSSIAPRRTGELPRPAICLSGSRTD